MRDRAEAGTLWVTPSGDVIEGRASGRRADEFITVFDGSGVSLQNPCMADALIRAAAPRG